MSEELVRRSLETALQTWATTNSVSVAWENAAFEVPAGVYVRSNLLPGDKMKMFLDGSGRKHVGVYQVTLCIPEGQGTLAASNFVTSLDAAFTTAAPLTSGAVKVFIVSPMTAGPHWTDAGRYCIPVSCTYTAAVT